MIEVASCAGPATFVDSGLSDVWSLGVLLLALLTGRAPWQSATLDDVNFALFKADQSALFTHFPVPFPVEMLLRRALNCDPRTRASLRDLRAAFFLLENEDLMLPSGRPTTLFFRRF